MSHRPVQPASLELAAAGLAHAAGGRRTIAVGDLEIGPDTFVLMAGPCAVESEEQLTILARALADARVSVLRGGAFKPRTSPHSFQGLGDTALSLLMQVGAATQLPVVTELLDPRDATKVAAAAAIVQVGARSMHNAPILEAAAHTGKPVLLKRNPGATVDEWLAAAEYIFAAGNPDVILCERGIRTFEPSTRYTLDLGGVVAARRLTDLPIVVDPSHAAGRSELVPDLAAAAVAAGADGLLIEVHPDPSNALSDGAQSLTPDELQQLANRLEPIVEASGRSWICPAGALA